jgi:hypothetical protein
VVQYGRGFSVLVNGSVGRIARKFTVLVVVSRCWGFLGGGFGVGWFPRLRDCVVSWFAREGGSAALPSVISRMVFEIFFIFFLKIFV